MIWVDHDLGRRACYLRYLLWSLLVPEHGCLLGFNAFEKIDEVGSDFWRFFGCWLWGGGRGRSGLRGRRLCGRGWGLLLRTAILLRLLLGQVLSPVDFKVRVLQIFLERRGETGGCVFDVWDLQPSRHLDSARCLEKFDHVRCLAGEDFVYFECALGIGARHFEIVFCERSGATMR